MSHAFINILVLFAWILLAIVLGIVFPKHRRVANAFSIAGLIALGIAGLVTMLMREGWIVGAIGVVPHAIVLTLLGLAIRRTRITVASAITAATVVIGLAAAALLLYLVLARGLTSYPH